MSFSSAITSWAVTHPYYSLTVVLFLCLACLPIVLYSRRNSKHLPYPPGPNGYPIIGNLLDVPTEKAWLTYSELSRTYGERLGRGTPGLRDNLIRFQPGDMVFLKVLGQPILVLNSLKRTTDLFEKRSSNYSDRMKATMLLEL